MTTATAATGIVGHERVRRALLESRAHAVLLLGPERVGRRTLARWLAARLNCRAPRDLDACGECASCLALAAGAHPDVLEVGPRAETRTGKAARASVIPIKAISERHDPDHEYDAHVIEWLETGARYNHKVVIVDGAQYLNEAAANALLKTVEEPPHAARFVFVADDALGVIPTIVSRSAPVRVPPVDALTMERALVRLEPDAELDVQLLDFAAGRPGVLFDRDRVRAVLRDAGSFVAALDAGPLEALTAADALEKRFDRDLSVDAVRFLLRDRAGAARVAADRALTACRDALERYASPSLAFAVLALALRDALGLTAR